MNFWLIVSAILVALLIWRFGVVIIGLFIWLLVFSVVGIISLYGLILHRIKRGFKRD